MNARYTLFMCLCLGIKTQLNYYHSNLNDYMFRSKSYFPKSKNLRKNVPRNDNLLENERFQEISIMMLHFILTLQWRHNERDGVSNHHPHDCLPKRLFRRRSKKTSKLRVTGLCAGNSLVTGEFPAQRASNAENIFIWWRHHYAESINNKWLYVIKYHPSVY